MAYIAKGNYGYGDGTNGDVANPSGQINSYANVTAYTAENITIGTPSNGIYEKFTANSEIMIHVSATNGTSQEFTYLGKYVLAKIKSVAGSVLTIDTDFTKILPVEQFSKYQIQAITIARFQNMELKTTTITPPQYSVSTKYGGILLAKCSNTVTFSGGNISLVDKGIPIANLAYRPLTMQEKQGSADTDKYSGWENHITIREFLLNAGDGACMLWAKNFAQTGTVSRIGGTTAGAHYKRGNKGGSTIALICQDIQNFDPSIISKTKNSGQGLGRCYIASKTKLRNDEGLYAYDCISDPTLVMRELNIKSFGEGSLGNAINPKIPINNYARVTSISADGKTIQYTVKTTNGMAQIGRGSLVMFHVSKHKDAADMNQLGKFIVARVLADDGNTIVLDTSVEKVFSREKLSKYNCQIIGIAEFANATFNTKITTDPVASGNESINTNYIKPAVSHAPAWNGSVGGICVVFCRGILDLRGGGLVTALPPYQAYDGYRKEGLKFISNAGMYDILPIGGGFGSIFICAKEILVDNMTRIGGIFDGRMIGSKNIDLPNGRNSGYKDARGGGDGELYSFIGTQGGFGSNAGRYMDGYYWFGYQGAHNFIIAETLNKFTLAPLATGGTSLNAANGLKFQVPKNGDECAGAGYGGWLDSNAGVHTGGVFGGVHGQNGQGGGGSAGFQFMYVKNIVEFDDTGMMI